MLPQHLNQMHVRCPQHHFGFGLFGGVYLIIRLVYDDVPLTLQVASPPHSYDHCHRLSFFQDVGF